ncbi:hypothetical protein RND81_06G085900 [Saponaria officinalis]|uniref:Protein TIFY n=1 Tax=Saponaria officinalis TaxID=3572 RepID=A0AAW1K4W7_SAPOF
MQRTLPSEKQGGSQYPITSHHWHQNDLPPINHPSQPMYVPGNASNLVTSAIGGAVTPANGPVVGSTDLRSSPSISSGPCQLTIFYNGSVCVYDHVSPEKAQAIMLLAGNGDSTKPIAAPITMLPTPKAQPSLPKPPSTDPLVATQPPVSRVSVIDIATPIKLPTVKLDTLASNHAPARQLQSNDTTIANEPPSTRLLVKDSSVWNQAGRLESSATVLGHVTQSIPVVASTSGSEGNPIRPIVASVKPTCMEPSKAAVANGAGGVNKSSPSAVPQARKASLARFLEKRQERVVGVSPYPVKKNSTECNTIGFGSSFATNFVSSKKQLDSVESKT